MRQRCVDTSGRTTAAGMGGAWHSVLDLPPGPALKHRAERAKPFGLGENPRRSALFREEPYQETSFGCIEDASKAGFAFLVGL